jgi:hypothetical protein
MTSPTARTGDPTSSHLTVASLGKDRTLKRQIVDAAYTLNNARAWSEPIRAWDDDDLVTLLEARHGHRYQRNVIARTRGLLEADGWFERIGLYPRNGHRPTMHFRLIGGVR